MKCEKVLNFWFEQNGPSDWYKKDPKFDEEIRQLFLDDYYELAKMRPPFDFKSAQQALAAIIILDQFSRNMFRDTPQMFETDPIARQIADMMVEKGWDHELPKQQRHFVYLPYMHSESLEVQEKSLKMYAAMADDGKPNTWAVEHHRLIEKYGRFPHRNTIVGRISSDAEKAYLKRPDAGF